MSEAAPICSYNLTGQALEGLCPDNIEVHHFWSNTGQAGVVWYSGTPRQIHVDTVYQDASWQKFFLVGEFSKCMMRVQANAVGSAVWP